MGQFTHTTAIKELVWAVAGFDESDVHNIANLDEMQNTRAMEFLIRDLGHDGLA